MNFAIKAPIGARRAATHRFIAQKTMYGGKAIAVGDTLFLFDSENEGGTGLCAMGVVTAAEAAPRTRGVARQTPRVTVHMRRTALARRPLGRAELRPFNRWRDGRPETELNFKFYRQATNKLVGISDAAASFLRRFFAAGAVGRSGSAGSDAPVSALLSTLPAEVAALGRKCLGTLRRSFPGSLQLVYEYPGSIVVAFGMTERGSDAVVALAMTPREVRLYLDKSVPDPKGLLQGSGAAVRSVVLRAASELDRGDVRALVTAAIRHSGVSFPRGRPIRIVVKQSGKRKTAAKTRRTSGAARR